MDTEEEESDAEELDHRAEEAKSEREQQAEEKRRGLRSRKAHDALGQSREGLRWMRKKIDKRRGN